MFFISFFIGIPFTKWYLQSHEKRKLSTTTPAAAPIYEEISPPITQHAGQDTVNIVTVENQAYASLKFNK